MKITITHLRLTNFKGIKSFEIFPGNKTTISADNAVGKTTLFDAHNWLWTGKDSQDRKDFEIKPLDQSGKASSRVISEVEETIDADGQIITLKRAFEEKWQKKRGATEPEYVGNETSFWYNDVPCNQSEFKAKIDLIISEDKAKLLTNPLYFNQKFTWQQRRSLLSDMAGEISDESIIDSIATAQNKTELGALITSLNNKTLEDYKKEVSAKRKILKEKLEQIPTRIDEAERSKPEPVNESEIKKLISEKESEVVEIEKRVSNLQAAQEGEFKKVRELQAKRHDLQTRIQLEKSKAGQSKLGQLAELGKEKGKVETVNIEVSGKIDLANSAISVKRRNIASLSSENDTLREAFNKEAAMQFIPPTAENCPSCGKPTDTVIDFDALRADFETKKETRLGETRKKGLANKVAIEALQKEIESLEKEVIFQKQVLQENEFEIQKIQIKITEIQEQEIPTNETILSLEKELSELVIPEVVAVNVSEDLAKKKEIEGQIAELRKSLSVTEQIARLDLRVLELKQEERTLAQELADHEKIENIIMEFSKAKIEAVESKIASLFSLVRFKMFNSLINGGEEPTCVCLVNGVPYSDLNTAMQINAGLDIINTLSAHYGVFAPIWIDGKESVNELLKVNTQLICLAVGKEKSLTIIK